MTPDKSLSEKDTLGDFLRKTRLDRGLDIEQVSNETKIPQSILRAMESDDHAALPAPAFARGFYNLYAKTLSIKPEELSKRCTNIKNHPLNDSQGYNPQHLKNEVTTLAARPSVPVFSLFGTALVLLLVGFAILCWLLSWNPADYLSKQLRKLDSGISLQQDQSSVIHEEVIEEEPAIETVSPPPEAASALTPPAEEKSEQPPIQTGYTLKGSFTIETKVIITLDEGLPQEYTIAPGETRTWVAAQSIIINLPSTSGVNLILNDDIPISLPTGKPAVISIPEYFFD